MPGPQSSISERLDGQHVLLTGVTGFVGEALLQLMLTEVPGVRVTVLVRPKGSTSGTARTAALLQKPIFADVVDRGRRRRGADGGAGRRPRGRPVRRPARCRPTSTRSCTAPATSPSTRRSTRASAPTCRAPASCWPGSARPVRTSTTCTSRRRTSRAAAAAASPRGRSPQVVDLEAELAWGLSQRQAIEHRSRGTEVLTTERKKAEKEHSRAGLLTAANATEEARKQWVKDELVRVGAERARSLGWTDCYTFTKALGERIVEEHARTNRVSIVRPSIIESALVSALPGLDRGLQDDGAADPGLRPRRAAGDARRRRHDRRRRAGRPRRRRDRRRPGAPAGGRRPGVLPRLLGRPQPADLPGALPERARLLRRPPVHLRRPRRDPAARVALPGLAVRRAAAQHQRARLQGGRLRHRARAAQRPHPRPGPQARPAGPAAGVPAPLPGALPGVRPGGAAVLRHQHAGALPVPLRGRPGDVRLRHGGRRLEGLPPGHPLPGRHGADPAPRRGAGGAQATGRARRRRRSSRSPASRRSSTWTARCCPRT